MFPMMPPLTVSSITAPLVRRTHITVILSAYFWIPIFKACRLRDSRVILSRQLSELLYLRTLLNLSILPYSCSYSNILISPVSFLCFVCSCFKSHFANSDPPDRSESEKCHNFRNVKTQLERFRIWTISRSTKYMLQPSNSLNTTLFFIFVDGIEREKNYSANRQFLLNLQCELNMQ